MRVAADSLAKAGVVQGGRLFRVYASLTRRDRDIRAGTYLLHKNSSWSSVLEALRSGKGLVRIVTIPEGFSLIQIEPLLAANSASRVDSVDAATRDTALLQRSTCRLEPRGLPLSRHVHLPEATTARAAVLAMVRRFEQIWKPEWTPGSTRSSSRATK